METQDDRVSEVALIETTDKRAHFSKVVPGLQIAWDSTSLGDLKTCPRKYYYSNVLALRSRREATPLTFGIHYHAALEFYERQKCEGVEHEAALRATTRFLAKEMGTRDPETGEWTPWQSDDTKRNWFTCIRAVVWYLDQFGENDALTTVRLSNGRPAVELSFRMELPHSNLKSPDGDPILLCGHMDRVVQFNLGGIFVTDHKTTTSQISSDYFKRYSPDNQMTLYTLAARTVLHIPARGVIISGVQLAVGFTRFQRGFVHRTEHQLAEWVHDLGYFIEAARRYAETRYWPHNDKACGMYGGCVFQDVCSRDPAVRPSIIATNFERKEWNPLVARGE